MISCSFRYIFLPTISRQTFKYTKVISSAVSFNFSQRKCFHHNQKISTADRNYIEFSKHLDSVPYYALMDDSMNKVRKDLLHDSNQDFSDVLSWTSKVFDYNVKNGKKIRGTAVLKAFITFTKKEESLANLNSEEWKLALVLAWCIEMLQAFFLICDDIMDQSELRRGMPCWYKQSDVGLCAINDSLLLQCGINQLLMNQFQHLKCYKDLLHLFLQVTQRTVFGQCLDMLCNPPDKKPRFESFDFKKYQAIVENKTSFYTYYLPVHLAMHLASNCTPDEFDVAKDLCLKLGLYFQSQDDYLDAFGDPSVTGKYGNDIKEGKCTWFAVKFLEKASNSEKEEFMKYYGVKDNSAVQKVMDLYQETGLKEDFDRFDDKLHSDIQTAIESLHPRQGGLYYNLFSQIRKREK